MKNTKISWAHHTFNPIRGCTKVSAGCTNCYADELSKRNPKTLGIWGDNGTRVLASESMWREPEKWNREAEESGKPVRVFCASLADVFEDWQGPISDNQGRVLWMSPSMQFRPEGTGCPTHLPGWRKATYHDVRARLFELIDRTPFLNWLLLTKRPENIKRMITCRNDTDCDGYCPVCFRDASFCRSRPNVWLGTTVENQEQADKRIPDLLKCRDLSPVLFLSCEPLLGPVDFRKVPGMNRTDRSGVVDWVIVGGESGRNARPMHPKWARSLLNQCQSANVPFFFKSFSKITRCRG